MTLSRFATWFAFLHGNNTIQVWLGWVHIILSERRLLQVSGSLDWRTFGYVKLG